MKIDRIPDVGACGATTSGESRLAEQVLGPPSDPGPARVPLTAAGPSSNRVATTTSFTPRAGRPSSSTGNVSCIPRSE